MIKLQAGGKFECQTKRTVVRCAKGHALTTSLILLLSEAMDPRSTPSRSSPAPETTGQKLETCKAGLVRRRVQLVSHLCMPLR